MPEYISCPGFDCMAQRGKPRGSCIRCLGHGFITVNREEAKEASQVGEPLAVYLHEWRCHNHATDEAISEDIERLWICLKCGDVSLLDVPTLIGCDVKELDEDELDAAINLIIEAGGPA